MLALGELSVSPFMRTALLCLLAVTSLGLAASLLYVRRARRRPKPEPARERTVTPVPPLSVSFTPRTMFAATRAREGAAAGGGLAAVASAQPSPQGSSGRMACPSCRREFDAGVRFCTYDSRRLVPASEVAMRSRVAGSVCPRCRRAYDAGIRYCPHDADELIPIPLWEATHGKRQAAQPMGVVAKICPQCAIRYDLAMSFCGRDGTELMTVN